jgi:hypothetical protein
MTPFDPNYTTNIEKRYIVSEEEDEETYTLVANSKHEVSSFEVDFADSRPERDERGKKKHENVNDHVHSDGKVNATNKIYGQRNGLSTCLYRSAK